MAELDYEYISGLVKKAQKGNSDAFAEIYAATYQKQYKFTYQYVKDAYLAQDILQEVYILVLKNITKIKNPRLFISWLNQKFPYMPERLQEAAPAGSGAWQHNRRPFYNGYTARRRSES